MKFERELLDLIRLAAPTPSDMAELLVSILADYTPGQRRELYSELEAAGLLGAPGGYLAHSVASEAWPRPDVLAREVPPESRDWLLRRLDERFPRDGLVNIADISPIEQDVLGGLARVNRLVVVFDGDRQLAPLFQFERSPESGTLLARFSVQRANRILNAGEDPWGALSWWTAPNGWLGGESPANLVGTEEEGVVSQLAESLLTNAG